MSGIAGLGGTGNWGTDERPKNFRESILWYNPQGEAPIFALTSKAGKRVVDDPEFSWWTEGNNIVRLQVNGAHGSGDTTITVDSPDPTSSSMGAAYGTATHLKAGDILMVEPAADAAAFTMEYLEVQQVLSDTQFVVSRAAGGTSAASISNDQWLTLIGSAYAEGTGVPPPTSRNPIKHNNYTQIFKDTYELTGTADATATRTGNTWSNDKKRKMWDHSRAIEYSMLFGRKAETVGENGKPKRFMGGIRSLLPTDNVTIFSQAVTPESFAAALAPLFNFSTGAGDTRMAFVGNAAHLALSQVMNNDSNTHLHFNGYVEVYKVKFAEFVLPNGRILLKSHPLLSIHPLYKKSMFIIDFDALKYVTLKGRDTKVHDDVQNKDEDLRRGYIQTECSIELGYGGLTMGYLGNISAT